MEKEGGPGNEEDTGQAHDDGDRLQWVDATRSAFPAAATQRAIDDSIVAAADTNAAAAAASAAAAATAADSTSAAATGAAATTTVVIRSMSPLALRAKHGNETSDDRYEGDAAVDDGGEVSERHSMASGVDEDPDAGAVGAHHRPKDQVPLRRTQRPVAASDGDDAHREDDLDGDENGEVDGRRQPVVAEENVRVAHA